MDYETNNSTITIKTIDKKMIHLTGDFQTVSNIMDILELQHQYPKQNQQLIFSGKVLKENDKIPEMGQNSFIVLLMKKTKVNKSVDNFTSTDLFPTPETNQSNIKPDETTIELDNSDNNDIIETISLDNGGNNDIPDDTITPETTAIETSVESMENNPIPSNPLQDIIPNQEMVENLMTMGFEIDDIKKALKITKNNLEMAGALLMEPGMIEKIENNPELVSNTEPTTSQSSNLTEEQVMTLMEQHPQEFQQLIGKIIEQQPEIANLVQNDPTSFITLFTKILNETGILNRTPPPHSNSQLQIPSNSQPQIEMTTEEKELLTGLQQMFPHLPTITILETLRACGNNEEMTANLLFDYD